MQIEYAKVQDRQELLDFLWSVFSSPWPEHPKFEAFYPDLFLADDDVLGRHAIIRENGKIVACVGTYLILMQVCGRRIMTAGVGQVATLPECRGKGYMTALITHELDRCRREGAVVAHLGGRRDRYSRFGFDNAGLLFDYTLDAYSFRSVKRGRTVTHAAATTPGAITESMFALRERTADSAIEPIDLFRMQMTRHGFKFDIWSAFPQGSSEPDAWAVVDMNTNRVQEWSGSFEGRVEILHAIAGECGKVRRLEVPAQKDLSGFMRDHCVVYGPSSATIAVLDRDALIKAYGALVPADFVPPPASVKGPDLTRAFFGPGRHSAELPFHVPGIFHV